MRQTLFSVFLLFLLNTVCYSQREFWGTCAGWNGGMEGFIFKTDSIGDNLQKVHIFSNAIDGQNISSLLYASNNKLYGMAASGGTLNSTNVFAGGTFFEYDLATDQFRVLQSFGLENPALPGVVMPVGDGRPALTEVSPGVLMGLMQQGRYVFLYNVNTGVFTKPFNVPTFNGGPTNGTLGNYFYQAFHKAADGNFYAATTTNSMCPIPNPNMGSIIRVNPQATALTIRHRAACLVEYGYGYKGFFAEANGKLYGVTGLGGTNNEGVIFEYNMAANTYTKRHDFAGSVSGYEPTSLAFGKNGKLYGTAHGGGIPEPNLGLNSGAGVLFEFDPATNAFAVKHSFTLTGQSIYDMGVFPSGLISHPNGKLYGATQYGVFEYNPTTEEIRVAGRFNGLGFAPSFVQVCRKPAYVLPAATTYTVCEGAEFSLDLASTNATMVVWKHNGTTDALRTTPILSFSSFTQADAGTWVCTLTNECGNTIAQTITLQYGQPAPPTVTASGSLALCAGEDVTLTAATGYNSYTWSNGATARAITVSTAATYTVTGNNGCESQPSTPITVIVNQRPAKPAGAQAPTASGALSFCTGGTVTLTAPAGYTGYAWSSGQTTPSITVSTAGNYAVSVSDGCFSEPSDPITVTTYPLPAAPTAIELPAYDRLKAIGTTNAYEWTYNGQVITDEHESEIAVNQTGTYQARSINEQGCRSANFASIDFIVTAVEETTQAGLKIYPNPAKDVIHLQALAGTSYGATQLYMYDATGRPVLNENIELSETPVSVSIAHIPPGLYEMIISQGTKLVLKKLAIQ